MPFPTPIKPMVASPRLNLVVLSALPEKLRALRFTPFRSGLPLAAPRKVALSFTVPTAKIEIEAAVVFGLVGVSLIDREVIRTMLLSRK